MLIILFGLAGSGKNFVGEVLAAQFGYYFWDADQLLPEEAHELIRENKPFSQAIRDQLTDSILNQTTELLQSHSKLVVAQALYREINRETIRKKFPDALFIHVKTNPEIIAKRLIERSGIVNHVYAKTIVASFEEPMLEHKTIFNNEDETFIRKQIKKII